MQFRPVGVEGPGEELAPEIADFGEGLRWVRPSRRSAGEESCSDVIVAMTDLPSCRATSVARSAFCGAGGQFRAGVIKRRFQLHLPVMILVNGWKTWPRGCPLGPVPLHQRQQISVKSTVSKGSRWPVSSSISCRVCRRPTRPARCWITSICRSTRTPRSACSASTAPANRRCCGSWPASTRNTPARPGSPRARGSATSNRSRSSTPPRRCARTSCWASPSRRGSSIATTNWR